MDKIDQKKTVAVKLIFGRPTRKGLATGLGVSESTIGRIINSLLREKVILRTAPGIYDRGENYHRFLAD